MFQQAREKILSYNLEKQEIGNRCLKGFRLDSQKGKPEKVER